MLNFEKMNQTFNLRMGKVFTVNGDDGASAYEIAVENGFRGTEEEWLQSLHGKDGQPGRDGTDGAPGADGKSAYQYAVDGGYAGSEAEFAEKLAEEVDLSDYYTKEQTDAAIEAVKADGLELIESIVLKENVSNFIKDTTPDGKPYNFRRMIIDVYKPPVATTGYMWLTINNMSPAESRNRLAVVSTHDGNQRNAWCDLNVLSGRIASLFVDTNTDSNTIVSVGVTANSFMGVEAASINAIQYYYGNFPADTEITIYGEWMRDGV